MIHEATGTWQQLSSLYETAVGLEPAQLEAWLQQLDTEAHPLVAQLRRMLDARHFVVRENFLSSPPILDAVDPPSEWVPGRRVGPYRLDKHLGSGGMAEVWLADRVDGAFNRKVAIKLLLNRPGHAERESFVARFQRERDILAALAHPNIASLQDAGLMANGQPWLALEYVQGETIADWCDRRRQTIAARIRAFRQVLLAVEHAHANLVLHRDLKPGNILVTDTGEVRLLDFGIATLMGPGGSLRDVTDLTLRSGRPLTPQYASPEQLLGKALSTASDVYSLGVVLHELLCGQSPYELAIPSAVQLEHAILDVEPRAPSRRYASDAILESRQVSRKSLRQLLRRDLDAVVLKTLAKSAEQRYSSVEALRVDLDRWVANEPVAAAGRSVAYVARKFVIRHRKPMIGTAAGTVVLAVAASWAGWMSWQAGRQGARAVAAQDFVISLFKVAEPDQGGGKQLTAHDMLEAGRQQALERLRDQPELRSDVLRRIGEIQGYAGDYTAAAGTLQSAIDGLRQTGDKRQIALAQISLAEVFHYLDDLPRASSTLDEAEANLGDARGELFAEGRANIEALRGWIAYNEGKYETAISNLRGAVSKFEKLFGANDSRTMELLLGLAKVEALNRQFDLANEHVTQVVQRNRTAPSADAYAPIKFAFESAEIRIITGQYAEGIAELEAALRECDRTMGSESENCVRSRVYLADVYRVARDLPAAVRLMPVISAQMQASVPPRRQAYALTVACHILASTRNLQADDPIRERLRKIGKSETPESHSEPARDDAMSALIEAWLYDGELGHVVSEATLQLARISAAGRGGDHKSVGTLHHLRGLALQQQGDPVKALADLDAASSEFILLRGDRHPLNVIYGLNRVRSLVELGRVGDALQMIDDAIPILRASFGANSVPFRDVLALRAEVLQRPKPATRRGVFYI